MRILKNPLKEPTLGKRVRNRAASVSALLLLAVAGFSQQEYVAGYLIIPTQDGVAKTYNAGYSMYIAAWPLLRAYPGHRFQTGLPGTWMFAQYDNQPPKDMYSDVEGGLGWWTDTRFPTETPKFIMGGVGPNFSEIANGPGHGWGTWEQPRGLYGVAQLSPWLLFPPDGLNLKQGTCGELFGYGYLNLPLLEPKSTTEGKDFPTGGNCWTLFLNTQNFKGPVAFFTPHFWSHGALNYQAPAGSPGLAGQLLDTRPADPNRQVQMETQYIPCRVAVAANGLSYARIAPTSFPDNASGRSILVHQDTVYNAQALWNSVRAWFAGGPASTGAIDESGSFQRNFPGTGYSTWEIRTPMAGGKESKVPIDWSTFATPTHFDTPGHFDLDTFGFIWDSKKATRAGKLVTLPEYFYLRPADHRMVARWAPIRKEQVPLDTGLQKIKWVRPAEGPGEPYTTPDDPQSSWKKPGPVAGPFKAHLGDGTVVTYYWYRFADQPAILKADLTDAERERLQAEVVKIHRAWPKNRNYLAPPKAPGQQALANIDPALIVQPPKGLEFGYVPIATRQELERH